MAVASNEPYQRVSRDNGVFDGMFIGMAVAAGGASAGVFGARMNYNGIDKSVQAAQGRINAGLEALSSREQKALERYDNKIDRIINRERTAGVTGNVNSRLERRNQKKLMNNPNIVNLYNKYFVEKPLNRLERNHQKTMERIRTDFNRLVEQNAHFEDPSYINNQKANHIYRKHMGGWKNAAIIGASAVIGGGIGMITDALME